MKVPSADPKFNGNELKYLTRCLKSRMISSQGPFVKRFENDFAKFCGTKYAASCCNGTAALHLALMAYGIGCGDEVIIPDVSFVATGNAVLYVGADPVMVDISPSTYNMKEDEIEKKISKKTKAIIVVHLYGRPCYMHRIMEIAKKHSLVVIEDAAEAHGASIDGKKVGSIGHCGCFSMFANKIMTSAEGGMVTTNDPEIDSKIRILRDHGMTKRFWHPEVGYNYRMTALQAAVGVAQLERIDEFRLDRAESGVLYEKYLQDSYDKIDFPYMLLHGMNAFWMFPLVIKNMNRNDVLKELAARGVEARPFFYPFHGLPMFMQYVRCIRDNFPVSSEICPKGICLPTHSPKKVKYVCDTLKRILK